MNLSLTPRQQVQALLVIVAYTVWAVMAWLDATLRADFLKFNVFVVITIVTHFFRDMGISDATDPVLPPILAPPALSAPQPTDEVKTS